jgi:chromatin segregation and condensation protein Rec8/ScpA/Scc1 (kleisin family)
VPEEKLKKLLKPLDVGAIIAQFLHYCISGKSADIKLLPEFLTTAKTVLGDYKLSVLQILPLSS